MPGDVNVPVPAWEVIIVGGGPAGLSAALTLGRCRRRTLLIDAGAPRNRSSRHMHCFISRDGVDPAEFLGMARAQLSPYPSIERRSGRVVEVERRETGFGLRLESGRHEGCRKLLLATGVVDELPPLPDIGRFYGRSIHHCPYCDGWEWRDQSIAVYGPGEKGGGLALMMRHWSPTVTLLVPPGDEPDPALAARLARHGIGTRRERVLALEGRGDQLERITFERGAPLMARALFFNTGQHQRSLLAAGLGVGFDARGGYDTQEYDVATRVPGLYVAGDAVRDVQLAIVAAAEGTKAAFAINKALLQEAGLMA